jgi:hypothetical protein
MNMATPGFDGTGIWQCSVQRDEETGLFVGHCLNLHVKVAGRDPKEAWASLKRVAKTHFEFCYENDREGLRPTARPRDFIEWSAAFEKAIDRSGNSPHVA